MPEAAAIQNLSPAKTSFPPTVSIDLPPSQNLTISFGKQRRLRIASRIARRGLDEHTGQDSTFEVLDTKH